MKPFDMGGRTKPFGDDPVPAFGDPNALRDALIGAFDAIDGRRMAAICSANTETILKTFSRWLVTAPDATAEPDAYHHYLNGMYYISKFMQDCIGVHGLFGMLTAANEINPFAIWERNLQLSQKLMQAGRVGDSIKLLNEQLNHASDSFPLMLGYRHMGATTHWYISQAHLRLNRRAAAVAHAKRSLDVTREIKDHPTYEIRYVKHLLHVCMTFGDYANAAEYAAQLASLLRLWCEEHHNTECAANERRSSPSLDAPVATDRPKNRTAAFFGDWDNVKIE